MTGIGLCLPQLGPHVDAAVVRSFCEQAEAMGFTSLWVQEHLFFPHDPEGGYGGRPGAPVPEPYHSVLGATELLSAAAAWTSSVLVGTSVLVGGYHRPVELAQRLATIDVLSGGRLVVGLGVGWSVPEHRQSDVPMGVRGVRLGELVDALVACWADDPVAFEGRFFTIPPSDVRPKPRQRPRPPLLSGAWSEAGLARTVAQFDGWNPAGLPAAMVAEIRDRRAPLRPAGMAPLEVWHRSFLQRPNGTEDLDGLVADTEAAVGHGFREVIVDVNFSDRIQSPADWGRTLDLLAPLLDLTT